jgi:hypothetical protein
VMGLTVDNDLQILMAFETKDSFELVAFQGYAYDEGEIKKSMQVFQSEAMPIITGLKFVSQGAKTLLPDPQPGDMEGHWWGWYTAWRAGLDGTMQMDIDTRSIIFWHDGYFYDGTPPDGLKPVNRDGLVTAGNTEFGTYAVSGGTLTLTYADGHSEDLTREGDGWSDGDRTLAQVKVPADGMKVDGIISSFNYSGFTPGSGTVGGVASGSDTTFRPDGTYEGSSFAGVSGNFENGTGDITGGFTTSSDKSRSGRYEVRDGLLIRTPDDGSAPTESLIYWVFDDLYIGSRPLETGKGE